MLSSSLASGQNPLQTWGSMTEQGWREELVPIQHAVGFGIEQICARMQART